MRGGTAAGFTDVAVLYPLFEPAVEGGVDDRTVDDGAAFVALDVTVALVADCCIAFDETRELPSAGAGFAAGAP